MTWIKNFLEKQKISFFDQYRIIILVSLGVIILFFGCLFLFISLFDFGSIKKFVHKFGINKKKNDNEYDTFYSTQFSSDKIDTAYENDDTEYDDEK
jgi:hypothetical protein